MLLLLLLGSFSRERLCATPRRQPTRLPVPGILQARTPEWVAISFSNAWKWKVRPLSKYQGHLDTSHKSFTCLFCLWSATTQWVLFGWPDIKEYNYQWKRCKRHSFNPCIGKIPRIRKWQPTLVFHVWKIP